MGMTRSLRGRSFGEGSIEVKTERDLLMGMNNPTISKNKWKT
jgi:hypothetical protein